MKEIKVQYQNTMVGEIYKQYLIYKEYLKYYNSDTEEKLKFIQDSDGIPCIHYDLDFVINQEKSDIIFVEVPTEGIHVIKRFNSYNKNKKYIIFSNGWWDTDYHKLEIDYVLVDWNYTLLDWVLQISNPRYMNYYVDKTYQYRPKENLFCSFIGVRKPPRDYLVGAIVKELSSISYILNYNGKQISKDSRYQDINYNFDNYNSYKSFDSSNNYSISASIPFNIFNNCYFNLVVETNANLTHEFHLSEKILKPLTIGSPFVLMASPGYLKKLKELGFKTFDSLWSEEYDTIENFKDRADAIVELIKSLVKFDWLNNCDQLKAITDHNRINLVYNNKPTIAQLENFERVLINL